MKRLFDNSNKHMNLNDIDYSKRENCKNTSIKNSNSIITSQRTYPSSSHIALHEGNLNGLHHRTDEKIDDDKDFLKDHYISKKKKKKTSYRSESGSSTFTANLHFLPLEILEIIFDLLTIDDTLAFIRLNKYWYYVITKFPSFWKHLDFISSSGSPWHVTLSNYMITHSMMDSSMSSSSSTFQSVSVNSLNISKLKVLLDRAGSFLISLSFKQRSIHLNDLLKYLSFTRIKQLIIENFSMEVPFRLALNNFLLSLEYFELRQSVIREDILIPLLLSMPKLVHIRLHQCPYDSNNDLCKITPSLILQYAMSSLSFSSLKQFSLNLTRGGKCLLARSLILNVLLPLASLSLISLRLSHTLLPIEYLVEFLPQFKNLEYLNLNNGICHGHPYNYSLVETFCQLIGSLKSLKSLHIANAQISLSTLYIYLTNLEELDLSFAYSLSDSILIKLGILNPSLKWINLSGCQKQLSANGILSFVADCPLLSYIDLSFTLISLDSILQYLSANSNKFTNLKSFIAIQPFGLSSSSLISFCRQFGKQLTLLNISGQSTVPLDVINFCHNLLNSHCTFLYHCSS